MPKEKKNPFKSVALAHHGSKIVLPNQPRKMETQEAIDALYMIQEEQETMVGVSHEIPCFPLDGAVAMQRALLERYGHSIGTRTPPKHFFDSGSPPVLITVPTGPKDEDRMQVPWGSFKVPGIDGLFETDIPHRKKADPAFVISGNIKKKDEAEAQHIGLLTQQMLREHSIYKGKAIRVKFDWIREDRAFDPNIDSPEFMDTDDTDVNQLILPEMAAKLIRQGLFTPIEHTDRCRKARIPLKRGVLLKGPYGCGKTLTAKVTARKCVDNGWTFLYLEDVNDLALALRYAKLYAPCVIFAEDVDKATNQGRTDELNKILNTIDGVEFKNSEIITVVSTNHPEQINKAMVRPGRLDAVVPIEPPDQAAAARLIKQYGGSLLTEDIDIDAAAEALQGQIPATIRECVERAKLIALEEYDEIEGNVNAKHLRDAFDGMKPHLDLMDGAKGDGPSAMEVGLASLGAGIGSVIAARSPLGGIIPPPIMGLIAGKVGLAMTQDGSGPLSSEEAQKEMTERAEAAVKELGIHPDQVEVVVKEVTAGSKDALVGAGTTADDATS